MSIWVKCMYVYGVWMCVREFWSVHAFYGAANALYWKCLKRQNSTYLTLLKHQNTKTSLYKLSKNHWVITLLENFGSVRRKLQSTVFLDHPVLHDSCRLLCINETCLLLPLKVPKCSNNAHRCVWVSGAIIPAPYRLPHPVQISQPIFSF